MTNAIHLLVNQNFIYILFVCLFSFFIDFSEGTCSKTDNGGLFSISHLSISNWAYPHVRPRLWDSTFVAFSLIWSSISLHNFGFFLGFFQLWLATILDKIFGTKWSNQVKLDRKRKVCCVFLCVFSLLLAKSKFLKGD